MLHITTMDICSGLLGYIYLPFGMWNGKLASFFMTVSTVLCILDTVASQCSEAHRQTCYWSYLQLQELNQRSSPTYEYIPDFNSTTLTTVCRYYNEYRNCSQPFLSSCDENTVIELQTYDVTLGFMCSDGTLFQDYLQHKACFKSLQYSHTKCKQKGLNAMADIDVTSSAYKYVMCGSARDYVLCIYTATALGCSMQAAEVYFKLLNHSIGSMFSFQHYDCKIQHPMDVISIYTTTPSTTTTTQSTSSTGVSHRGDNQEPYTETSGSKRINPCFGYIIGCVLLVLFSREYMMFILTFP